MPTQTTTAQIKNLPKLRFPGFSDGWEERRLGGVVIGIQSGKSSASEFGKYDLYGSTGIIGKTDNFSNDGEYILVARVGANAGRLNLVNNKFGVTDNTLVIDLNNDIYTKFLFNSLKKWNLKKLVFGSGQPLVTSGQIKKIKLNIPLLSEQEKIATFLTTVDEKIEKIREKKKSLEEYKKGLMQGLFKPTPNPSLIKEGNSLRFPGFNGEWEEKKLGEVCEKESSNISANTLENNTGNYKIYGAAGLLKKIDFYQEENDYLAIVKDGAGVGRILFCEKNSSVLGTLDKIKLKKGTNLYFLLMLIQNINFEKYIVGSTIPHIYFKDYSKEEIQISSLPEQEKIANFLSAIDEKMSKIDIELDRVVEWKRGLLQGLFV